MSFYLAVFNGLDFIVTGPFAQEEHAEEASKQITLTEKRVFKAGPMIRDLPEFVQWEAWDEAWPEFKQVI